MSTVFRRAEERARTASPESEQLALRKLVRQLRSLHEELSSYRQLLAKIRGAAPGDYEALVAANRQDLGAPFFAYLEICIKAAHVRGNPHLHKFVYASPQHNHINL